MKISCSMLWAMSSKTDQVIACTCPVSMMEKYFYMEELKHTPKHVCFGKYQGPKKESVLGKMGACYTPG